MKTEAWHEYPPVCGWYVWDRRYIYVAGLDSNRENVVVYDDGPGCRQCGGHVQLITLVSGPFYGPLEIPEAPREVKA